MLSGFLSKIISELCNERERPRTPTSLATAFCGADPVPIIWPLTERDAVSLEQMIGHGEELTFGRDGPHQRSRSSGGMFRPDQSCDLSLTLQVCGESGHDGVDGKENDTYNY